MRFRHKGVIGALLGCCVLAVACGSRTHVAGPLPENALRAPSPRLVGRLDDSGPRPRLAWSGTTFEVRFSGTGLTMRLRGTPAIDAGTTEGDASVPPVVSVPYSVSVDGQPARVIEVNRSVESYEIASRLDPRRSHVARITREGEAFGGVHELVGFEVPTGGEILPAAPKGLRLEFVGDSITCGYGVLGKDASCSFSFATERASAAYPALVAAALDADATSICWSGRGVYRNFDRDGEPGMPELYERTLPQEEGTYSFAKAPPVDAVVVNLGTNDFLADHDRNKLPDPLDERAFVTRYVAFLERVRDVRPSAAIVITTSPMLSGALATKQRATLERVVSLRREAGDGKVELLELEEQGTRVGCDAHPNAEMHAVLAAQIVTSLKRTLGR